MADHSLFWVKVITQSSRVSVEERADGSLLVRVHVAPEKGKANEAVRKALAGHFHLPVRCIEILRGQTSSRKQIRIVDDA
ncbi:hypothetical protein AUK40_02105 [Candidatus Wirthbacteria bacterium CG2_30_54_11]|uniref:Uncharacterized protein n=1 Tax=Candidatus Wirthbacteria bacterium CG2_30_54_11 TaxID=1817892 RepID=A0A1J5ILU0_9BACT|nr:MAG: hypothetical protein AUK40_02105 [Candidatus Wirthbacteria bacterium CG2_30_54_11]